MSRFTGGTKEVRGTSRSIASVRVRANGKQAIPRCAPGAKCVYVYICSTYYKTVRVGGRGILEDMCYEGQRAEACVD